MMKLNLLVSQSVAAEFNMLYFRFFQWTPGVLTCPARRMSFLTGTTLGGYSSTRPTCPHSKYLRYMITDITAVNPTPAC